MTTSVELTRAAEFQRSSRARGTERPLKESGGDQRSTRPTDEPPGDGVVQQMHTAKSVQQAHTAETSQPERDERGPARGETSGASYRTSRDQRGTSGDQPARGERTPAGGVRPVARAAGRARSQRFRATSADRSESVIRGGARGESARRKSQTLGGAKEFEDGRKRQAALRRSCPLRR